MTAGNNYLTSTYLVALVILVSNILNIAAWSTGSYVPPIFYILLFLSFFILTFQSDPKSKTIFIVMLVFILLILGSPVSGWDARSIWFFHAKRIFLDNNLYAQLDDYAPWSHNDYPVLLSALAASIAKGVGCWNEFFPRLAVLIILFPILLIFNLIFKDKLSFNLWIIGTLLICRTLLYDGYMDGLLALYCSAATLLLVMICSNRDNLIENCYLARLITLFSLILISLPFMKNEGLLAAVILFAISLPVLYRNIGYLIVSLLISLIYWSLWKSQLVAHQIHSDLFTQGLIDRGFSRLSSASDIITISKSFFKSSGIYLLVLLYVLKYKKLKFTDTKLSFLFIFLYLSAILTIYCITPHDLIWHLRTSASRTFLTVNMCIFSILIFLFSKQKAQ